MDKVFVLLSGGVDSTTCLAMARNDFPDAEIECVTVNYGQRHIKEAECAKWQADQFEAYYMMINAKGLMTGMLVDKGPGENNEDIPQVDYADLPEGISPTYVSYRNGLMLSILAARAQAWVMERQKAIDNIPDEELMLYTKEELKPNAYIYIGTHADDGARDAYPDCTAEFIGNQASAIYIGTYFRVRLRAPIVHMEKSEVVAKGSRLGVDYSRTWSCYAGGDLHCGVCPTCRQRKDAFIAADILDPTEYAA